MLQKPFGFTFIKSWLLLYPIDIVVIQWNFIRSIHRGMELLIFVFTAESPLNSLLYKTSSINT